MMRKCVLLVCDQSYMDFAARLVDQIRLAEFCDFDILIASPDPLSDNAKKAEAIHLPIKIDDFIETLPVIERLKHYTYWRFPAIELASQKYDRILYLDIDIFCAAPGINDLLEISMNSKCLAAVTDVHLQYRPKRTVPEYRDAELEHAGYFNAGVMLIDGFLWRKEKRFEQLQRFCTKKPEILSRHDQSALNMVFYKDWLELSPVWNWQYSKRNAYIAVHAGPRLVHYAGEEKIWNSRSDGKIRSHWLSFNCNSVRKQVEKRGDISNLHWQCLLSSIWYRKSFLTYLEKFSDDLATIPHN